MTDEPKSDIPAGTPEGHTKEEAAPSELGEPGTPGAGLTATAPHAADAEDADVAADPVTHAADPVTHHDGATHIVAHTVPSDEGHGHAEAALGPIDWSAWVYAIVGALLGVVVLVFFWLAVA